LIAFVIVGSFFLTMISLPSNVQAAPGGGGIFALRSLPGAWGTAKLLEHGAGDATSPQVAMDSQGNAIVVWEQTDGTYDHVYTKRFSAGAWGTVTSLGKDYAVYDPQVAMDNHGNIVVVWSDWSGSMSGSQAIYAKRFSAGAWGTATLINTAAWSSVHPQVAMDSYGNAIVVMEGIDYTTGATHIYADRFTAGAWGTAKLLEHGAGDATSPQVAMDSQGNAVVVWEQNDGAHQSIYSNIYDADA
jgi:hypothetical protein